MTGPQWQLHNGQQTGHPPSVCQGNYSSAIHVYMRVYACVCVRVQRVCFASDGPFNMTKDKQGGTICKVNRRLDFIMQPLCQNTCFVCVWNQSVPSCKWAPSVAYRCHFHVDSPFCFCFHGSDRIYLSQMLFSIFIGTSVCLCVCPPDCLHLWCLICVFSLT